VLSCGLPDESGLVCNAMAGGARSTRRAGAFAAALAVLALVPAAAPARVLRAENILPPGQSGFVSGPGLVDGTGSPHLYDQLQPFIDFRWKSALFNQPGDEETPRPGVRIVRDRYGVPAVTGATDYDLWWGAGYAVAQDRLFELELFRRATQGTLSELAGASRVGDDKIVRQNFYTGPELDSQFSRLPASLQTRFNAYSDGINAWIAHTRTNPGDLPGEFAAVGLLPADWATRDSVAIGVYLARTTATNADPEGLELANMRAVQLGGHTILDRLAPLRTPGQLPTVPPADGRFPSQPGRTVLQERAAFERSYRLARSLPFPQGPTAGSTDSTTSAQRLPPLGSRIGGSYMFAVRRPDNHAVLFNGPQVGFTAPERLIELELHRPGLDIRGMTAPGAPVIASGHNDYVSFGVTTGASDADDLYAEELVPGQPERYRFRGRVLSMSCRNEPINYRDPPSSLLPIVSGEIPPVPRVGTRTVRVCRTIHGPVEARAGNVAYARRYAIWNREVETLQGLAALNDAHNIREVDAAVRRVTWNENVMAVDSAGNIGFWHPGLLPLRTVDFDERLPYPGTGEAEWRRLLDRQREIPFVINPRQGWLANWNNVPAEGWTSGDGTARKRMDGAYFRVGWLMFLARRWATQNPTFEGAQDVIRQAGTVAQQFPLSRAKLGVAVSQTPAGGRANTVLNALLAWNGSYHETDEDETVDPGVATWDVFRRELLRVATPRFGRGAHWLADENVLHFLNPGYHTAQPYHYFDATHLESQALRQMPPIAYRIAAARSFEVLTARFDTEDATKWREKRRPFDFQGLAGAQPPPLPFFDRGTYEQFVETGP